MKVAIEYLLETQNGLLDGIEFTTNSVIMKSYVRWF